MIPANIFIRHQELLSDHEFLNRSEKELIFRNLTHALGVQSEKSLVQYLDKLAERGPMAGTPFIISKQIACATCGYHRAYNCKSPTGFCVPVNKYGQQEAKA